jgi:hypothetical protein
VNRLTSARTRRETYAGPWLPEPVVTEESLTLGPLETVEQRESVSMAMLVLLERLTPPERAVFVLREAFGYGHREIAEILGVSESSSQQLYHRARQRLAENRQSPGIAVHGPGRYGQDLEPGGVGIGAGRRRRFDVSREEGRRIAERFLDAARGGDLAGLERMLSDDVVAWADSGGKARAARRPIVGAGRVARYFAGWTERELPGLKITVTEVNGEPAFYGMADGILLGVAVLEVLAGRVTAMHTVANPDKLAFMAAQLV